MKPIQEVLDKVIKELIEKNKKGLVKQQKILYNNYVIKVKIH